MSSKLDKFLDSFNNSVLVATRGSYGGKWPMPYFTSVDVGMAIDNCWCDLFLDIVRKLKERRLSAHEIATRIEYPSPFSRAFYANLQLKAMKYPVEKMLEMNEFVAEMLYYCYKKDIFCADWTNTLWDTERVKEKYSAEAVIPSSEVAAKYNGYLRAITEMLFFYWDNFGHEIHGPYKLADGKSLLVREWHDLKPGYYEFPSKLSYDHIRVYEVYEPNTSIKIDISNRVQIEEGSIIGLYFECGNKILTLNETRKLVKEVELVCDLATKELASLPLEKILENAVTMHFYLFKPLTDILGVPWKPPEEVNTRISNGLTEADKKAFLALIRTHLDKDAISQLFDYRLELPLTFNE